MKVLRKLQEVRVQLQKLNLKKSGKNNYAGFSYYELADFLPQINDLCFQAGLSTMFSINEGVASLTVFELETGEKVEFKIPYVLPLIKGANEVQNLGGAVTYLRRYLYMVALEIIEADVSDAVLGKEDKQEPFKKAEIKPVMQDVVKPIVAQARAKKDVPQGEVLSFDMPEGVEEVDYCTYGKNKGKAWQDFDRGSQVWYLNHMIKKPNKSETDLGSIKVLQKLIELNLNSRTTPAEDINI